MAGRVVAFDANVKMKYDLERSWNATLQGYRAVKLRGKKGEETRLVAAARVLQPTKMGRVSCSEYKKIKNQERYTNLKIRIRTFSLFATEK